MENARESIANINNTILPGIKTSCGALEGLCDEFISMVDTVLGENLFQSPLPDLPADIQSNLESVSNILSEVEQAITKLLYQRFNDCVLYEYPDHVRSSL